MAPPASGRPKIVVFACACCPERGSEDAIGWGLVRAVARFADPVVLVGAKYGPGIREWQARHPGDPVEFVEIPEPWWERKVRRFRPGDFLAYVVWVRRAGRRARELARTRRFDLAHHATYSTFWLPSPIVALDVPAVWGPVGGAVTTSRRLWPSLGVRGLVVEWADAIAVRLLAMTPGTRRTWHKAAVRLVLSRETRDRLPARLREETATLNHVLFVEDPGARWDPARTTEELLHVSPLESRKGGRLVLRALASAPGCRLAVVGDGPERASLERFAERVGIADRVRFVGRIPRDEVFRRLSVASAAVFAGTREEGGVSLAEAMLCGVPVIALDHGGPREILRSALDPERVFRISPDRPAPTAAAIGEAMVVCSARARRGPAFSSGANLDRDRAFEDLRDACRRAMERRAVS